MHYSASTVQQRSEFPCNSLHDVGREVRQSGPLTAHQRDVARVWPAAEPVYSISQARRHFREIGCVDLGDIAQTGDFGSRTRPGNQGLHLLWSEILSLIEDDEPIQEGSPAHEVQGTDLDPVPEQIIGRGPAPVAAFLAAREHL